MGDSTKKFMFDTNFFDDRLEEIDGEPPPPTFSLEELEAAKAESYKQGFDKATEESANSLNQAIANTLSKISKAIAPLFAAEQTREERFEQEALHLSLHIFETLFPVYKEAYGFEELKQTLANVIEKNRDTRTINVYVAPELSEGVGAHMGKLVAQAPDMSFEVNEDETLTGTTDCRLSWQDGGAFHNPGAVAKEVGTLLKQTLAQKGFTRHDECIEETAEDNKSETGTETDAQKSDKDAIVAEDDDTNPPTEDVKEEKPDE